MLTQILLQQDVGTYIEKWLPLIVTALNGLGILYISLRKSTPEIKKMGAEADNEMLEGAERSAKLSEEILTERINDLKKELEELRENSKQELQAEREARSKELATEREARRREGEYLRRRIKEAERDARDLRSWAANLVKQVVALGGKPVPFVPSIDESEQNIPTITIDKKDNNGT